MNLKTISTNLAAQFATGTLATPSGADAMRSVWGQAPHGPKPTPFLVVEPRKGTVTVQAQQIENQLNLDVLFFLSKAPGDIERVETQRQLWLASLLTATYGNLAIDLEPTVLKAIPTEWEFVEIPYGADNFDGIVIHYTVYTREQVTLTP